MIRFILNKEDISTTLPPGTILLDFIRYHADLKGTKIGCREGDCGVCTVLVGDLEESEVEYLSFTSCLTPLGNVHGKHVLTIEGLRTENLNPIQQAFADESATQCGFCTPGFVVSLTGYVLSKCGSDKVNAVSSMDGNICRCTGYKSIERAAASIAQKVKERQEVNPLDFAVSNNFVPAYLKKIPGRLLAFEQTGNGQDPDSNEIARFLGGGTDLYVQRPEEMEETEAHFLYDKKQYKYIREIEGQCLIGGETTATDLGNSALFNSIFPNFARHLRLISSTPIRNMATIAGNFSNGSPIGDFTIYFLALDAQLKLEGRSGKRILPLRDYYLAYKKLSKTPDEMITEISFSIKPEHKFNFEKVSKRTHLDIASVNSAFFITADEKGTITGVSLSAGGVGPVPKYLTNTSAALVGETIADLNFDKINQILQQEISPITDARGSEKYKRLLLLQLLKCHFITLYPEINVALI